MHKKLIVILIYDNNSEQKMNLLWAIVIKFCETKVQYQHQFMLSKLKHIYNYKKSWHKAVITAESIILSWTKSTKTARFMLGMLKAGIKSICC